MALGALILLGLAKDCRGCDYDKRYQAEEAH